jgi:trehalose-6-phosphate synthase
MCRSAANRNMTAYESIQSEIEQAAGRINGRFGRLELAADHADLRSAIPFVDLVSYYRAADVCWITPLADGMNLVCKEFIAARVDGDGVLVLSEFAGAAVELQRLGDHQSVLAPLDGHARSSRHLRCRRKNAGSAWR